MTMATYMCLMCPLTHSTHTENILHMRTHLNVHPFRCMKCGDRFSTGAELNLHVAEQHKEAPSEDKEDIHHFIPKERCPSAPPPPIYCFDGPHSQGYLQPPAARGRGLGRGRGRGQGRVRGRGQGRGRGRSRTTIQREQHPSSSATAVSPGRRGRATKRAAPPVEDGRAPAPRPKRACRMASPQPQATTPPLVKRPPGRPRTKNLVGPSVNEGLGTTRRARGRGRCRSAPSRMAAAPKDSSLKAAPRRSASQSWAWTRKITPRKVSPRKITPRKANLPKTTPRNASPRTASPQTASPQTASPRKTTPRNTSPRKASPRKTTPRNASPRKTLPRKAAPRKSTSRKASARNSTPQEEASAETLRKGTTSKAAPREQKEALRETPPKKVTPQKPLPRRSLPRRGTQRMSTGRTSSSTPKKFALRSNSRNSTTPPGDGGVQEAAVEAVVLPKKRGRPRRQPVVQPQPQPQPATALSPGPGRQAAEPVIHKKPLPVHELFGLLTASLDSTSPHELFKTPAKKKTHGRPKKIVQPRCESANLFVRPRYTCDICNRRFSQEYSLQYHKVYHS